MPAAVVGMQRAATPVDSLVGKRIRAARLEIKMSQQDLAAALGVTFQQVQKYEKGVNRIAIGRLVLIAQALNKSVLWFIQDVIGTAAKHAVNGGSANQTAIDGLATAEGAALMATFAQVKSPAVRRRVLSLVKALVETDPNT